MTEGLLLVLTYSLLAFQFIVIIFISLLLPRIHLFDVDFLVVTPNALPAV
jgi:hypothetical protein